MSPADKARLGEIKERLAKATPGPWYLVAERNNKFHPEGPPDTHWVCPQPELPGDYIFVMDNVSESDSVNASLIANAPADLTFALEVIERLEQELIKTVQLVTTNILHVKLYAIEQECNALRKELAVKNEWILAAKEMFKERDALKAEVELHKQTIRMTIEDLKEADRLSAENKVLREALETIIKSIESDSMIDDCDGSKRGAGWAFYEEAQAFKKILESK